MKLGTKAVLFGVHQFILHPMTVWLSWLLVYRAIPGFQQTGAIVLHDIGYIGCNDLDGPEGRYHPILGAAIADRIFGATARDLALAHSRTYAQEAGIPLSALCLPDKLSLFLYPAWLYSCLAVLSGEMREFQQYLGVLDSDRHLVIHVFRVAAYRWAMASTQAPAVRARISACFGRLAQKSQNALPNRGREPLPASLALDALSVQVVANVGQGRASFAHLEAVRNDADR